MSFRSNQNFTTSSISRVGMNNDPIQMFWLCREKMAGGVRELEFVSTNPKSKQI